MEIVYKKIGELKPYKNNPRKNDEAVDAVAASISEFGWKVPVVIDTDNVIVAGHTRYKAAKKLGIEDIPCIVADDLSDEQVKAYRLADNKVSELAGWDFSMLDAELYDIPSIDMGAFGFDIVSDEYGTDFTLDAGEKSPFCQMTFNLAEEQAELIKTALQTVSGEVYETFGNTNSNGNALYEVVREWTELKG